MGRPSRYPDEFRHEAVQMALASNESRASVARRLGVNETTLIGRMALDAVNYGEVLITDLSGVGFIDSTGLGALVMINNCAQVDGHEGGSRACSRWSGACSN